MSRIRNKDTQAELAVRSILHRAGYRFRLHRKDLPGKPDIVLPKYKAVVFVHGCFWHKHKGCKYSYTPKTNVEFWAQKLEGNVRRDKLDDAALRKAGYKVITVWECEVARPELVARRLRRQLIRLS